MNVKEAIAVAKQYVKEVYSDETVSGLGLEETEYDDQLDRWLITVGFSRPWNTPRTRARELLDQIGALDGAEPSRKRVYKVLTIDKNGEIVTMKNRQVADADG